MPKIERTNSFSHGTAAGQNISCAKKMGGWARRVILRSVKKGFMFPK
jgi:hypothetical protein